VRADVTSTAMPPMGHGTGDIGAREGGVVAGLGVAELEGTRARVLDTRKTLPTCRALHSVKVFDLGLDLR